MPSSFLSNLTTLQTLSIGENPNLAPWIFPEDLSQSSTLVTLSAGKCNLVGAIPDIFESFPSLQSVRLSYNNLTGPLPRSFSRSGIQNLWINNQVTGLSGRIDVIGAMSQLAQVWLHANAFSGPIPDLSKCVSLFDLQLRDNQLTGVIPASLFPLPKLVNISLQNNKLQGPYPNFRNDVEVTLGTTNRFCNTKPGPCDPQVTALLAIAGALGYPMALAESWSGNSACEDWSFISCNDGKKVTVINFGKQHWTGTISPAIANLTSLRNLFLNDNSLTGLLPESLTSLTQLQVLDVSNNNLSGILPKFHSGVTVKTEGNALLQTNSTSGGEGPGVSPESSLPGPPPTDSRNGETSSGESKSSSVFRSLIVAGIIVALVVLIGIISLIIYKSFHTKNKLKKNHIVGSVNNGYVGVTRDLPSKSTGDNSNLHGFDGGNVIISIDVLRDVTNNFSESNILGKGGFGVVYRGELHDGTRIAVKRMESSMTSTKGLSEFQAEIAVLSKVRHRHLVALLGFCINGNERLLVYEYMPQGTLGQHLFECDGKGNYSPLTWNQRITMALDVARGVEYLHSLAHQSFIHRDLKPSNVLLGDDMRAKVSDFGLVKNAPDGKYSVETRLAGTFGYLAPEYAATGRVTTKVDVFAFGVILMEIITGRKALDETLPEEKSHLVTWFRRILINKVDIRKSLDPNLGDPDEDTFESVIKVAELAGHCTAREPFQRPNMAYVVNVLAPLVDQWKPTCHDEEDCFGIDLNMSLPQALQRWQAGDITSTMEDDSSYTESSTPTNPSAFAEKFSLDGR